MRERVEHGQIGRWASERAAGDRRTAWRVDRRPARGPRPARPTVVPVAVRPAEVPRPTLGSGTGGTTGGRLAEVWRDGHVGLRLLARRSATRRGRCGARYRLRQAVAGFAVVAVSAAAVVALGLLTRAVESDAAAPGPVPAVVLPHAPVVVTAAAGETVWEVAARVAPGLPAPEVAALAERIVADNALTSMRLRAGQVLRVTAG
jgi:hypothetical protein